jgi:predicted ATPase/DNA-binding CsgD family transcriptional regulator
VASGVGGVHGFPPALTSFIGRAEAVRDVARLLEEYRLVTITGPGGSGKTRLADQVARQVAGRFADEVWLAELAAVRDPAQVAAMVAAALGIREQPGVPLVEVLAGVLARRQLLLVLDNCEHVTGVAAQLCAGLLAACDDVRVLTTSREPLWVAGETRYRLAPLTLPAPGDPVDAAVCESVALYADRARHADARFVLDEQTGPAVARLVARLDGLPLAIELAAARAEALGALQLLDRIDDRFALLTGGDRLAPGRQRSLAATMEWSYLLLDEREQQVFRQVSVFPGPFTLEGAEAVAGADASPAVLRLVDCSLLVPPRPGVDGRSRYVMLETLRAYAAGLLAEAGEADGAAAALARYVLRVAGQADAGLQTTTGEAAAARWLDAEEATTRQVLAWGLERDAGTALRLANVLASWWYLRGRLPGQYPLLGEAADRAEPGSSEWCTAQYWLGLTALFSADVAGALGHFTMLRDAVAGWSPSRPLAEGLFGRGAALLNMGRLAEGDADVRRALAMAREIGHPTVELLALGTLSWAASFGGDHGSAVRLARQAEQVQADIAGSVARIAGYFLTRVLAEAGELAAAERVCAAGLARSRDAGDVKTSGDLLILMAMLQLRVGRPGRAAEHLREGFQMAVLADSLELIRGLDWCGHLCAATGRFADAVTVWSAFLRHGQFLDWPADARRREGPLREARHALGPDRVRVAEERGAAMSAATAAEYALVLTDPGPPQSAVPEAEKLSARERELVTLVAQGRTNAQIAAQLYISIRTVGSHLDRIRDKTGCRRRADLTRLALSAGLV